VPDQDFPMHVSWIASTYEASAQGGYPATDRQDCREASDMEREISESSWPSDLGQISTVIHTHLFSNGVCAAKMGN